LIAAELPIMLVEAALAALMSFTLVAPLGVPWWAPLVAVGVIGAVIVGFHGIARGRRSGFWRGLAVLRGQRGRLRVTGLVIVAVSAQVARNWLVLNGVGVD